VCTLYSFKGLLVRSLLSFVVPSDERLFLLAIRTLRVVDPLSDDAKSLTELLLLLLELSYLDGD